MLLLNAEINIIIQKKDMSRFRIVMNDVSRRKLSSVLSSAAVASTAGEFCDTPLLDEKLQVVIGVGCLRSNQSHGHGLGVLQ